MYDYPDPAYDLAVRLKKERFLRYLQSHGKKQQEVSIVRARKRGKGRRRK